MEVLEEEGSVLASPVGFVRVRHGHSIACAVECVFGGGVSIILVVSEESPAGAAFLLSLDDTLDVASSVGNLVVRRENPLKKATYMEEEVKLRTKK